MSAEGVSFDVLKNTLQLDGFYDFDRKGFNRPIEEFWKMTNCIIDNEGITDDINRLIHYYHIHKKLRDEDRDIPLNKECINILRKYIKIKKAPKLKGLTFYTISPKERLDFNDDQINKLRLFCGKVFTAKNFVRCKWVVECGKHKENPNLHIHCVGRLRNKNFKRDFITLWNKKYDQKYNVSYNDIKNDNRGWDMKPCNTAEIQADKLKYLEDRLKGCHKNFIDLKIGGTFGFGEGG